MLNTYYFSLAFTPEEFRPYYQGYVETIQVRTHQGLTVRFPAMHLRAHITPAGINGNFVLVTENNKFKSLQRC